MAEDVSLHAYIQQSALLIGIPSPNLVQPDIPTPGLRAFTQPSFLMGSSTPRGPKDAYHINSGGFVQLPFSTKMYNGVYIVPLNINLGQMTTNRLIPFEVWNANLTQPVNLTSYDVINPDIGLAINTTSETIPAFQSKTYTLTATTVGPAIINTTYKFSFSGGLLPLFLGVRGSRLVIFGLPIDWQDNVTERLLYLTEIIKAYNGTEQRIKIRKVPRKEFTYTVFTSDSAETALLDTLLWGYLHRTYIVPLWQDEVLLASDVSQGDTTINVTSTAYTRFAEGTEAIIIKDCRTWEIITITGISGTTLTTREPIKQGPWPQYGTSIIPVIHGKISGKLDLNKPRGDSTRAKITFLQEVE